MLFSALWQLAKILSRFLKKSSVLTDISNLPDSWGQLSDPPPPPTRLIRPLSIAFNSRDTPGVSNAEELAIFFSTWDKKKIKYVSQIFGNGSPSNSGGV